MGVLYGVYERLQDPVALTITFLVFIVSLFLVVRFSRKRPGKNPFLDAQWQTPRPLVTDHAERNKVLKNRFRPSKVPDNLDAVVIGSGIGGLSVAVLLARAGKTVLVLEQHDQAGGCCHTFLDKEYEFDTGIHYVGKMNEGSLLKVLMDVMTDGQLVWSPMDDNFDTVAIGPPDKARRYPHVAGRHRFWNNLKSLFPDDAEAIDAFSKIVTENYKAAPGMMVSKMIPKWLAKLMLYTGLTSYSKKTLGETLRMLTDNVELRATLAYAYGDLSALPDDISLPIYCGLLNHYVDGAYYPRGGPSEIAFHMIPQISSRNGQVLVDAPVSQILLDDDGIARGVTVTKSGQDTVVMADIVISDAGLPNTYHRLLPKDVVKTSALYKLVDRVGPSTTCVTLFVGLEGSKEELGIPAGNTWAFISPELERDLTEYLSLSAEEACEQFSPMLFVSFPSAKDPSWGERFPGRSTCEIIALVPYRWFEAWKDTPVKRRGVDYNTMKKSFGKVIWHQMELLFPSLEGKLDYLDVGSPLSNSYYLGCMKGEIYGLSHGKARMEPDAILELRPETDIPALYLTGQDVFQAGFAGALIGGLLCASSILNRDLKADLDVVVKNVRKQQHKNPVK